MSTEKRYFLEAASLIGESAREDGAWKVRLISEGQGSSGFYSRQLLEDYHSVFNDVLSFNNHPTGWDGPESRSFTDIVGEILGDVWVEDDERGMAAITGWYLPDPEYRDKIERYKSKIGVSIYAAGEAEFDENTGNLIVTSFQEDPYNSLDVVVAAGARGKFLESMKKTYERRRSENASTNPVEGQKKESKGLRMDEETKAAFAALTTLIQGLSDSKAESAKAEADAAAVEAAVEAKVAGIKAAVAAVEAARADLLPSQVSALTESAYRGEDVTASIESAKTIAKEALEAAKGEHQETGRLGESAKSSLTVPTIWKKG